MLNILLISGLLSAASAANAASEVIKVCFNNQMYETNLLVYVQQNAQAEPVVYVQNAQLLLPAKDCINEQHINIFKHSFELPQSTTPSP